MARTGPVSQTLAVLASEVRRLVRDRRALFTAVLLPMVLYPVIFLGGDRFEQAAQRSIERRTVPVAHSLGALSPELRAEVLALWDVPESALEPRALEADRAAGLEAALDAGDARAWFTEGEALAVLADGRDGPRLSVVYDRSDTLSNSGRRRVTDGLRRLAREGADAHFIELVGADPAAGLEVEQADLAPPEASAGRELGSLLPLLLVLMLFSGGSFAALDAFAGEREAGTLETLFVQPAPPLVLATGKFLAVLATALVALVGNVLSFLLCVRLGLGELGDGSGVDVGLGRVLLGLVLFAPTAVLAAAVLCLVSARAKSFREGQNYVFPLILLAAGPAALALVDRAELDVLTAVLPVGGPALAFREALGGRLPTGPALLCWIASAGWAALALSGLARTLDAERLLSGRDVAAEAGARRATARRALLWGWAGVAAIYLVGGRLQAEAPVAGLAATLALVVPLVALGAGRSLARSAGTSLARALALVRPRAVHVLAAALLAPGLSYAIRGAVALQEGLLPLPQLALPAELEALGLPGRLVLLALLPALGEELLFRGAVLRGLRHDLGPMRSVVWQALLFALAHASLHRLVPTFTAGLALGAVSLRTRSLLPVIVLHAGSNALALAGHEGGGLTPWLPTWVAVTGGLAGLGLLAARARARP